MSSNTILIGALLDVPIGRNALCAGRFAPVYLWNPKPLVSPHHIDVGSVGGGLHCLECCCFVQATQVVGRHVAAADFTRNGTIELAVINGGESDVADAALHGTIRAKTHNSTMVIRLGIHVVDAYIGCYGAVLQGGFEGVSSYAADFAIASNAGIGQVDSHDGAAALGGAGAAEEALSKTTG